MVVERHINGYNIVPYKQLSATHMVIQHPYNIGCENKNLYGYGQNTVLQNLNLFSRNGKKPHWSLQQAFSILPVFQLS